MKYTHNNCPVCGVEFTENDDIVVCPECGTPHHRSCYKDNGGCINASLHSEGFFWQSKEQPKKQESEHKRSFTNHNSDEPKVCPVCGLSNHPMASRCQGCGFGFERNSDMPEAGDYQMGPVTVHRVRMDDVKIDDIPALEIADYIGPTAPIYLAKFVKMDQKKTKTSWNWVAAFLGPIWAFHKGLYKFGIILAALWFAASCLTISKSDIQYYDKLFELVSEYQAGEISYEDVLNAEIDTEDYSTPNFVTTLLSYSLQAAGFVVFGIFANTIYRKKMVGDILNCRENAHDMKTYRELVKQKGKGKILPVIGFLVFTFCQSYLSYLIMKLILQ